MGGFFAVGLELKGWFFRLFVSVTYYRFSRWLCLVVDKGVCGFVGCSLFWLRFCCWVLCYVVLFAELVIWLHGIRSRLVVVCN